MFDFKTHILVVDDMKTMRKLVMKACKDIGFQNFTEARDGAEAWEVLSAPNSSIGLVISDWNMPNSTGLDLLKRVRGSSTLGSLPFILLTAESEASQVQEALRAGVDNYIIKPFTTDSLRQKVEQVHKKRAAS